MCHAHPDQAVVGWFFWFYSQTANTVWKVTSCSASDVQLADLGHSQLLSLCSEHLYHLRHAVGT